MDYYNFRIETELQNVEILLAFLGEMPFDSFMEKEYGLDAYLPQKYFGQAIEDQLLELQKSYLFSYQKELIKGKNWNEVWESNFSPLVIDDFCAVRADFHQPVADVDFEIIITPKMAFGTGHHETTFMMLQSMKSLEFYNKKVLDYGCGTGILAILASKLGAREIQAVDIEIESFENTIENTQNNGVPNINAIHGTIENIEVTDFDVILANINRNVILDSMDSLYKRLVKNGKLIVSGILMQDETLLVTRAQNIGFSIQKTIQKNNWICLHFEK